MKKIYYDAAEEHDCIGIISEDADTEIVLAGTFVYSMPVKTKNAEHQRYADEYDIHFIFEDNIPALDFFTVPYIRIFATDSCGGYLGELCCGNGEEPVCYIDRAKNCFRVAENLQKFCDNPSQWKNRLTPCGDIVIYPSKAEAEKELEFFRFPEPRPTFPDDFR